MLSLLKIILLVIPNFNQISVNYDSIVIWSTKYSLSANDFLAEIKPESDTLYYVTDSDAVSSCDIKVHAIFNEDSYSFYVLPYFNKNESWLRKNDKKLLEHEQIHFDITELIARKLRKKIQEAQINKIRDIDYYNDLINSYLARLIDVNNEFDKTTMHGALASLQEEFHKNLICELKQYEEFSTDNYTFTPALINSMFISK